MDSRHFFLLYISFYFCNINLQYFVCAIWFCSGWRCLVFCMQDILQWGRVFDLKQLRNGCGTFVLRFEGSELIDWRSQKVQYSNYIDIQFQIFLYRSVAFAIAIVKVKFDFDFDILIINKRLRAMTFINLEIGISAARTMPNKQITNINVLFIELFGIDAIQKWL